MRIQDMDNEDEVQRFWCAKKSMKVIVLAGRFFASLCKVDATRSDYGFDHGFEDAIAMQVGLDLKYKSKYNLVVHKFENGNIKQVYEGNPSNRRTIKILWYKENGSKSQYFGLNKRYHGPPKSTKRSTRKRKADTSISPKDALVKYWTYKLYGPNGVSEAVLPPRYIGDDVFSPFYRKISRKEFWEDVLRPLLDEFNEFVDTIVRTSINLDQFGKILILNFKDN